MGTTKKLTLLTTTTIAASVLATAAYAGAFALREQSAYYQGMSFAGNGTTNGTISSMYWNPATLAGAGDHITIEAHGSLILPNVEITQTGGANTNNLPTGEIGVDAFIPATYSAYRLNDQIVLGLSVNAPYGLATKAGPDWAGQVYGRTTRIVSYNAAPTVSYEVNEKVSLGLGLQLQYVDVRYTSASGQAAGDPTVVLAGTENSIGVGATAGISFKPFEGTEIGLGYRSPVRQDISGTIGTGGVSADVNLSPLTLPETVTLSAKHTFTEQIRGFATFEWTNWSRVTSYPVTVAANGAEATVINLNYDDGYYLAAGAEYDFNEKLTLRAGVAYEWSPVSDAVRTVRLPDNDRIWTSAGLTFKPKDNLALDLGYTHIFGTDTTISEDSNAPVTFIGTADSQVDIFSAALRYQF